MTWQLPIGAQLQGDVVRFRVWAPDRQQVDVIVVGDDGQELDRRPLVRDAEGYFAGEIAGLWAGGRYFYELDGDVRRPDPASRYQPESVHGPSEVVDPDFRWTDGGWSGIPLEAAVIYEVHIGTATAAGTFESFIARLPYLKELGVTAIEIMPVADFPGDRNWGYDGVCLFAPARAYGGPEGLKALVNAAHAQGLAVIQDVVYNHLGPDGNYLRDFSPHYFTEDKHTPWGAALDFRERPVREFFIANALYWAHEYHMDGLRLDATHAILDDSPVHILQELTTRVRESLPASRHFLFIAEDERNAVQMITPASACGMGMDAVWADDFHHQVRSAIAGDNEGYYADYTGSAPDLAATIRKGWFYSGQWQERKKRHRGTDASDYDPPHFVYCIQNHDQIGNRALGDRLPASVDPPAYRTASALLLLGPSTPLLFQGQEWGAETPFLFFTDHEPELGKLVTKGRREEFAHFASFQGEEIPDPQAAETFAQSKLRWDEMEGPQHAQMLALYRELLRLRHGLPAFADRERAHWESGPLGSDALAVRYHGLPGPGDLLVVVNLKGAFQADLAAAPLTAPPAQCRWQAIFSSNDPRFGGTQAPPADGATAVVTADGPVAIALQAVAQERTEQ